MTNSYDAMEYMIKVIEKSWTWERLTDSEKDKFIKAIRWDSLKGTKRQRIETLCQAYETFLVALDYDPLRWRQPEDKEIPLF